jgi:hypothetical protein
MIGAISAAASSGAIPPFVPSDIANLKAWYDASDTATITVLGTAVSQWNDKSGNAYDLTQSTTAYKPQSGTRTQNGLNMLDYDGGDVLEAATASDWTFMHNATGCTVFMAMFIDNVATNMYMIDTTGGTSGNTGVDIYRASGNLSGIITRGVNGTYVCIADTQGALTANTAKYWYNKLNAGASPVSGRSLGSVNNSAESGNNTENNALSTASPFHPLWVGHWNTAYGEGVDGGICEVIIYSGAVSSGDITTINNYLATKWGI